MFMVHIPSTLIFLTVAVGTICRFFATALVIEGIKGEAQSLLFS